MKTGGTFARVPNAVLRRRDISAGAKLCYGRLLQYAGRDGQAFPLQESLALELGATRRAVRKYVAELVKTGLVKSQKRGRHESNTYLLLCTLENLDGHKRDGLGGLDGHKCDGAMGTNMPEVIYHLKEEQGHKRKDAQEYAALVDKGLLR